MPEAVRISDAKSLMASLPSLMGVIPDRCCAAVCFTGEGLVKVTMRIDMEADTGTVRDFASVLNRHPAVLLVIVHPNTDEVQKFADTLLPRLTTHIVDALIALTYRKGEQFRSAYGGETQEIPDWMASELASEVAMGGRRVFSSAAEVARIYDPAEPAVASAPLKKKKLAKGIEAIATAILDSKECDPEIVGGVLLTARDTAVKLIDIESMSAHHVFSTASKFLRGPARVEALTCAAISAYVSGEGMMTSAALAAALDTAHMCRPPYEAKLAEVVTIAYQQGISPKTVKEVTLFNE